MERPRIITPHKVVISSQSLFGIKSFKWGLKEYTQQAEDLGVGLMYEPLRCWSPARRELDATAPNDPLLRGISYLAEPARSEGRIRDYLTKRAHWQVIYALMQESRFSPHMIATMVDAERKLATAHGVTSFPVQVYPDRIKDGISTALILNPGLNSMIYAQDPVVLTQAVEQSKDERGLEGRSQSIVRCIRNDCERYNGVAGIELNLRSLEIVLGHDRGLLHQVITDAIAERNPWRDELALVQAVRIQPSRVDLPGRNLPYGKLIGAVEAVSEQQFRGTIIYAPGGGNPTNDIQNLKRLFSIN